VVTTEDPLHLAVLNIPGRRDFFPEGDHNSEILQEDSGSKGGYKEIAMNPSSSHGYFSFQVIRDFLEGPGKSKATGFQAHRISGFFNGAENQSGLSMEEVFNSTLAVMDHRRNLKTDVAGNFYRFSRTCAIGVESM